MSEMFLPPFQINQENVILPQSQTVSWGFNYVDMEKIHGMGYTGKGIRIAVIDSGVESHEDLHPNIEEYVNTSGEAFATGLGHATAVAGIIAAVDNSTGVKGFAPDSKILAIKAMKENGGASYRNIIEAIKFARRRKVDIINLSLGGTTDSEVLHGEIQKCVEEGILVVCAAGNSGRNNSVMYPGKFKECFCVSAINNYGDVSSFVSRGWEVDVSAPGEKMLTTYRNNSYSLVSGTSFAAPVVSAIFACLLQAGIRPTHEMLKRTSLDIDEPGLDTGSGFGVISPMNLLSQVRNQELSGNSELVDLKQAYYLLGKFLREKEEIV